MTAPVAGVVVYAKQLGERVAAGDLLAEIVAPLGAARTPVISGTSGVLLGRAMGRLVRPGQRICKVAGKEPILSPRRGKLLAD